MGGGRTGLGGPCLPLFLCTWLAPGKSLNLSELQFPHNKIGILKAVLCLSQVRGMLKEGRNKGML